MGRRLSARTSLWEQEASSQIGLLSFPFSGLYLLERVGITEKE